LSYKPQAVSCKLAQQAACSLQLEACSFLKIIPYMKKQPLLAQLVEIVFKTEHQVVGGNDVDPKTTGIHHLVYQRVVLKTAVV
jgi:hypothetical protein